VSVRIKITQYGLSLKEGGWDTYGDSSTDRFEGNANNVIYNSSSCALTASARDLLGAKEGDWLEIDFGHDQVYLRRYEDTAPETDPRLDMFNAWVEDKQIHQDFADVRVVLLMDVLLGSNGEQGAPGVQPSGSAAAPGGKEAV